MVHVQPGVSVIAEAGQECSLSGNMWQLSTDKVCRMQLPDSLEITHSMPQRNLAQPGVGQMADRQDVEVTCAALLIVNPLLLHALA